MRTYLRAVIVALLLAVAAVTADSVVINPCDGLDPGGWLYWVLGCGGPSSGGGGSGTGAR